MNHASTLGVLRDVARAEARQSRENVGIVGVFDID